LSGSATDCPQSENLYQPIEPEEEKANNQVIDEVDQEDDNTH